MKDNFWEMGDTGPCGPCTEIHYDRIGNRDAAHLVNMDDPDVLEIWNNVFMQFNRENDGSLTELPAKSVDTGMGLERVASVLIDVRSNYDTDLFQTIFGHIKEKTGARAYTGKVGDEDTDKVDMAYRVVADHIRTLTIALTDGATPSNDGRGYVLRRILRRAVRFGREILGGPPGFFHKLVPAVLETLGDAFPELRKRPEDVTAIIEEEELQFGRTLDLGIKKFKHFSQKGSISGADAFILSSSFGFPIDLTQLMAEEAKIEIDMDGFHSAMAEFQEKSRKSAHFKDQKDMELKAAQTDELQKKLNLPATDESGKYTWDTQGDGSASDAKIQAIYDGNNFVETATNESEVVGVVLDRTPCYAEAGGQTFDIAEITNDFGAEVKVHDTRKYAGYVLHCGMVGSGQIRVGDSVQVKVDYARRSLVAKNHTATHILNYALRRVLGDKVDQKGSLVDEFKLRFDFSHGKPVEPEELKQIELICNQQIQKSHVVHFQDVGLDLAQGINGLRAVFGEQYPDPVRVVSVGAEINALLSDKVTPWGSQNSIEFCGGTHVSNSTEIYRVVLLSEEGISKGVRRIVAVTGPQAAVEATLKSNSLRVEVDEAKTLSGAFLERRIADLRQKLGEDKEVSIIMKTDMRNEIDNLKIGQVKEGKEAAKAFEKKCKELGEDLSEEAAKGGNTFVAVVDGVDGDGAKVVNFAMQALSKKVTNKGLMLLTTSGGKISLLATVPKDLTSTIDAGAWSSKVLDAIGGKGGGKIDRGLGQAPDISKISEAVTVAKNFA